MKKISESEIDRVERLHREQMRSKWEAEMEALRNKTHVHYQDILFDEKREHGVGFYKFSTDDKQRAEQMTTLNELRTNTIIEQTKFTQEKEKRQLNMNERLNKIRLRKAKEMGINLTENNQNQDEPVPTSTDKTQSDIKDSSNDTKEETLQQPSIEKNYEKQEELKVPEVIQPSQSQSSEQILQTTRTQQQQPSLDKPSSSFAYPFPVRRTNTNIPKNHTLHSSDKN